MSIQDIPDEVLENVFKYVPRTDLDGKVFMDRTWRVIEGGGKRLNQNREVEFEYASEQNQLTVKRVDGKKTIVIDAATKHIVDEVSFCCKIFYCITTLYMVLCLILV